MSVAYSLMNSMSAHTKVLLEQFARSANWKHVGLPSDMSRFFTFVIAAYRSGEHDIPQQEFLSVIGKSTTQREVADKLYMFEQYTNGIKLLKEFENSRR